MDATVDDVRGSAPVMSTKDIVLELYRDMKVVRPAVESLVAASLISRVELLEQRNRDKDTRQKAEQEQRGRYINWTNRTLGILISACTAILVVVQVVGLVTKV